MLLLLAAAALMMVFQQGGCLTHTELEFGPPSSPQFNLTVCHVCRSAIHGRGLFCKRNIEAGEMVIEYAGIVIRSVLTDKREKYYDSKVRPFSLSMVMDGRINPQLGILLLPR